MPYQMDYLEPAPLDPRAEQMMIPMRDCVRLATDVYLPDQPGRLPAVLVRLPYDKCARYTFMPQLAPWFNERGYVFIAQDVRGKFRSEGETVPFVHEIEDGYDTLDWITKQSWSDGVVGMWGDSYFGFTQWAAVASGHPALKAIVPRVTGTNFLEGAHWWGGNVSELYLSDYLAHFWTDRYAYDFPVDWSRRPLAEIFEESYERIGSRCVAIDRFVLSRDETASSIYPPARHPFDHLNIPVLHSVGWFDNILPYSMRDYEALCARPDRAHLQYLIADATDHENYHLRQVPLRSEDDHDTDDAALQRMLPSLTAPALDFFDVFLRGRRASMDVPRVRWFLGHDDWHEAPLWPPPRAHEMHLHLASPGQATSGAAGGSLAKVPETDKGSVRWVHDPERLVPSALEDPFSQLRKWPDEREIEARDDVVTFTSEPFKEPLDLAGPIAAMLAVGSTATSMHVLVKLLDVEPEGSARAIARGQARVASPDPSRLVRIDMSHTGYRVRAGHSLRLHVASSDFPLYLWHPGTGEDPWLATETVVNEQELVTGGGSGSYVALTVVDQGGGRIG
jgi:uncharacterized protein